ncbi:MAG TPA: type IX secretion system membrane protein PorP/SprF [Lunatimonas sp.]|nr:type IX secretion system membrane protein PorP/SprF [Lunatimonas sp.]
MVAGNQITFSFIAAKSMVLMLYIMWAPHGHAQQIPQYSQYTFNSLHINPAYAGHKIDPFVQATYRSQFMAFPGAPETFSITADMSSSDERMGFGASLFSDRLGATKIHGALLTYSYKIKVTDNSYLSMGVSAGTSEYVLDGNLLMPDDVSDMTIPMDRINMFTPNLNAGLFFHSEKFFSGLSVFNLVGQQNLENKDLALAVHNNHYFLQVGSIIPLSAETAFKPSILIREDFSSPTSFDLNAMFLFYDRFWVGTSYRSSIGKNGASSGPAPNKRNAIALLIDLFLTDNLRFGYAYDFNLSSQNNFINNSHEISLGYYLGNKTLRQKSYKTF